MTDDSSSSGGEGRREPRTFSGRRVLLGLLVLAVVMQVAFALLIWGIGRAKQSLPEDHPMRSSTSRPAEHITGADE